MALDIIVGAQWGDEGKGRIVDLLAAKAAQVARFAGGDNAGHTVTVGDTLYKLHLIPSGIVHPGPQAIIGSGVVVNPLRLLIELAGLAEMGIEVGPERLLLSHAAHLITPGHIALDTAQEAARGKAAIGTTLRGIGPAYTAKVSRAGLRAGQMLDNERFADEIHAHILQVNRQLHDQFQQEGLDPDAVAAEYASAARKLAPFVGNAGLAISQALTEGRRVLAEGAQGTLLDLDHGTYPFVTSSNPVAPAALTGLGIGLGQVGRVIGVTKVFQTRVGEGPFPTEVQGPTAQRLRGTGANPWDEFGTTTGRPRRVGWLDLVLLRYAHRVNGFTELALTKLDILSGLDELRLCTGYRQDQQVFSDLPYGPEDLDGFEPVYQMLPGWNEDVSKLRDWHTLPAAAQAYIAAIEATLGIPATLISVGPERDQVVVREQV